MPFISTFPLTRKDGLKIFKPSTNVEKLSRASHMGHNTLFILKGPYRRMPAFYLTLQERTTCPTTCKAWEFCYGDHMPFAHRMNHTSKGFYPAIVHDLQRLQAAFPKGFVIRLHELGDFFSAAYIRFWRTSLALYPALYIYGYTHVTGRLANMIDHTQAKNPGRFHVMNSDNASKNSPRPKAIILDAFSSAIHKRLKTKTLEGRPICPEQTQRTPGCTTCGLCMDGKTEVNFLKH